MQKVLYFAFLNERWCLFNSIKSSKRAPVSHLDILSRNGIHMHKNIT